MADLQTAGVGFKALFQGALSSAPTDYQRIAMDVRSTNAKEEYGWLADLPRVREWLGDRVVNQLATHGYEIRNRDFESTIEVKRNDVDDDNLGLYSPRFQQMGQSAGEFPSELVYETLAAGFATKCFDGQFFFDTDHPVLDEDGAPQSASNFASGSAEPWFLMDTSKVIKPLILQRRKDFVFTRLDDKKDAPVFWRGKYVYGTDGRMAAGYGLWQLAYGSTDALNATNFAAAYQAMITRRGDYGRKLAIKPDLLVTGGKNFTAARKLLKQKTLTSGEDNIWADSVDLLVTPWL